MIISQTPFRMSFFGGGTDYPVWFQQHGGAVLSTTINKYCYITCRHLPPFFEHRHRIAYSIVETVKSNDEIIHPAVKAVFQYLNVQEGLEIHHDGDLPARSGIGSSSSFTVGLLNALLALRGKAVSKQELAELAVHIEQNVIKEAVGSQDQIAAAFGGFNRIDFGTDGRFTVRPVIAPMNRLEELNNNLLVFFTGFSRLAAEVAKSQIDNFQKRQQHLRTMRGMVDEAEAILQNPNASLHTFGKMLHENWRLKRELSDKVSSPAIDEIYEAACSAGALGGKLLGAGGGGFALFYVPPEAHATVRHRLRHLLEVDYQFESRGTQIVLYNPGMAIYRRNGHIPEPVP